MTIPFVARCAGGTEIDLPASVQSIGHDAFYGCDTLTKVTFEDSFELIGEHAFDGCTFDGLCTLCGRTKEHITNHTAGEWNTVVEPTESTAPAPQRGGVPVWAVILIALCTAACGVGGTYLIIKKK